MNLATAIQTLDAALATQQPKTFNTAWIRRHVPSVYRFVKRYLRTVTGHIDWDTLTRGIDRDFQRRWAGFVQKFSEHEGAQDVEFLLAQYRDKLYVFLAPLNDEDKRVRDTIGIALVRMAQGGNLSARRELGLLLEDAITTWVEQDKRLVRWRGYDELLPDQINACIRRFRYAGSFIGYLYRTLECAGRGLRPLEAYSLDEESFEGKRRRVENVVQDPETGMARMFDGSR